MSWPPGSSWWRWSRSTSPTTCCTTPWWLGPVEAAALLAFARFTGLTWSELGLGGDRLGSGVRWGLGVIAVVAVVYTVGVLLPLTRSAFQDERYHLPLPDALFSALRRHPARHGGARGDRLPLRALGDARRGTCRSGASS